MILVRAFYINNYLLIDVVAPQVPQRKAATFKLPDPPFPFIGRNLELKQLLDQLRVFRSAPISHTCRFVNIFGPNDSGKSSFV